MISKERLEEIESYFWNETNDEDTQFWRDDLSKEEEALVSEWDEKVDKGMSILIEKIIDIEKKNSKNLK